MTGHLSVAKAAKKIGMTGGNLRYLIQRGKVLARKRGITRNSPWYIPLAEVERLKQAYRFGVANVS